MTQLEEFLSAHGLTVEAQFIPFSASRNTGQPHKSLNWRVTALHNGRPILTTDYSAGCAHCPAYRNKRYGAANSVDRAAAIAFECEKGRTAPRSSSMPIGGAPINPNAADVWYSLALDASVLDSGGFENWANEYGYDIDSRAAEATYKACLEIALQLRAGLGGELLEALQTAAQEY